MDKRVRVVLIIAAVAAAGYLAWQFYQGRKSGKNAASQGGPVTSGTGSNLNSVAPELFSGATAGGTYAAPGAVIPVNVTVEQQAPPPTGMVPMQGVNAVTPVNTWNQQQMAGMVTAGQAGAFSRVPVPLDHQVTADVQPSGTGD